MRTVIRSILSYALTLFIVTLLISGLTITGSYTSYLIAGALIFLFNTILDPVVKIITLPFNIITLGLLSFLTTLLSLFILSRVYDPLSISDFVIEEGSFLGLEISRISVSGILSFVVISATIYFLNKFILWVFSD